MLTGDWRQLQLARADLVPVSYLMTGAGLRASHQIGGTALVAMLLQQCGGKGT